MFAVVDVVTLGQAIAATQALKLSGKLTTKEFSEVLFKTIALELGSNAAAYTAGFISNEFGLPIAISLALSMGLGIAVSKLGGKYVFKTADGLSVEWEPPKGTKPEAIQALDDAVSNIKWRDNLDNILKKHGLTIEEFNRLRLLDTSALTNEQKNILKAIRESVPSLNGQTPMSKLISASDMSKYLDGTWNQAGGFTTRWEDVSHLNSYDDYYNSLRLDYDNSPFNPKVDTQMGLIVYKTPDANKIGIPYNKDMGGTATGDAPFTGNGFTGAINGETIPEYKAVTRLPLTDGSELYAINKDGTKELVAVYDADKKKFVRINELEE